MNEGFIHNGRLIYSAKYVLKGRSSIIVWFDRDGNDRSGRACHSDSSRALNTTQPGDLIIYFGHLRTVVSVAPYRQNWLDAAECANH